MAAIASSNVTYSVVKSKIGEGGYKEQILSIAFGNGALTYPAGGIPLLKGKMGLPTDVQEFGLIDPASANGFVYKYDKTNNKLRIYQGDNDNVADAPLIELTGAAAPAAATLVVKAVGW